MYFARSFCLISPFTLLNAGTKQILCFYGIFKEYAWESPNYTISLSLIITCAVAAAGIGALFQRQAAWHGMALFALFVVTGLIQYFLNGNVTPDELAVDK